MTLNIDLDEVLQVIDPTDLTVKLEGTAHRVRRLRIMDLERLQSFKEHADSENVQWLAGLFIDSKPDLFDRLLKPYESADDEIRDRDRLTLLLQSLLVSYITLSNRKKKP
ncbi:MAG TPA: hypothetical protein VGB55_13145 [Tepidisphaeraceae bacterium]|jgi:hypothetical protein